MHGRFNVAPLRGTLSLALNIELRLGYEARVQGLIAKVPRESLSPCTKFVERLQC